jgi:phospholipid/cholesterol/gamma-HCH transport system substrate-binding protein
MSPLLRRRSAGRKKGMPAVAIALIVIAVTVFITFYAFNDGLPFQHPFTANAIVSNAVFVQPKDPVRIAGVTVGVVTSTAPYKTDDTKITFTLQSDGLPIHSDATIRIRPRVFLEGAYYLDLEPGSPSAPIINAGGTIPLPNTQSYVQFYNLLSTFDEPSRNSLKVILSQLYTAFGPYGADTGAGGTPTADSGATGLKTALPQLTPALKDLAINAQALRGTQPNDVENLLASASDITGTLARNTAQLTDLVTSLDGVSGALAADDGSLARSVSGLDQTLQVAPGALTALDRALPPLVHLGRALDPSLKVAPGLLTGLTTAVGELARVVAPVERAKLLTTLRATFEQLPSVLTELGKVFPITKPVTDCLRTHVVPVLNETVPDGSLSTGQPAWQEFDHLLTNVAGADQDFDANGYWIRVLQGAGTNGLDIGKLPVIGSLLGSSSSSTDGVSGARPVWVGDLLPSDFNPGASCSSQPIPSLSSATAAPDFRSMALQGSPSLSSYAQLKSAISSAIAHAKGASGK